MDGRVDGLGGRLPLLTEAEVGSDGRALLERYRTTWMPWAKETPFRAQLDDGRHIGPFNPLLYSAAIGDAFLRFQEVEQAESSLDARTRQIVILSVGAVWAAPYELYAHSAAARKAGLTEAEIDRLVEGAPCPSLSAAEAVAQATTLELVRTRALRDDAYAAARAAHGTRGMADLVLLAGCYLLVCGLLNAFAIPAPAEA